MFLRNHNGYVRGYVDILLIKTKDTTMEITTTMVRFRCPKAMMDIKTPKAQMFSFGEEQNQKVWVPENKIIVKPSNVSEDLNECVMPKWLYGKTMLPMYMQVDEEFFHTENVETL